MLSLAWIGAYRGSISGKWQWSDGSQWKYDNWVSGRNKDSNLMYATINSDGKWDNHDKYGKQIGGNCYCYAPPCTSISTGHCRCQFCGKCMTCGECNSGSPWKCTKVPGYICVYKDQGQYFRPQGQIKQYAGHIVQQGQDGHQDHQISKYPKQNTQNAGQKWQFESLLLPPN